MTKLVGILNVTPDSFSDGGRWENAQAAHERMHQLFEEGANIIDVGAESTRPGAEAVAIEEEWQRLQPIVEIALSRFDPEQFSFDTRHGIIAEQIVETWSNEVLINDVTGLSDPKMIEVVAARGLRVVVSHLPAAARGSIPAAHTEKQTSPQVVKDELAERINQLEIAGIPRQNMIVDPGIGFGKHPDLNHRLIHFAQETNMPTMIGYSRKRFLGEQRFDPSLNVHMGTLAVQSGAAYLRVHDVAAHRAMLDDHVNNS